KMRSEEKIASPRPSPPGEGGSTHSAQEFPGSLAWRNLDEDIHREFRASLRQIIFSRVFLDHSPGIELRHQRDHRAADFLNPLARDPVGVAIEEAGDDFLSERLVEVFTVLAVLFLDGVGMGIVADGKAIRAV